MAVIVMRGRGVFMIVMGGDRRRVIMTGSGSMIVMTVGVRRGMVVMRGRDVRMVIMTVSAGGGRGGMVVAMTMVFVTMGLGRRMGGVVVVTVPCVGAVTRAMVVTSAVIVVRLVLVAHCVSVPQPLFRGLCGEIGIT